MVTKIMRFLHSVFSERRNTVKLNKYISERKMCMENIRCHDHYGYMEIRVPVTEIKKVLREGVLGLVDLTEVVDAFVYSYKDENYAHTPDTSDYLWVFDKTGRAPDDRDLVICIGSGEEICRMFPFWNTNNCKQGGCLDTLKEEEPCVVFVVSGPDSNDLLLALSC